MRKAKVISVSYDPETEEGRQFIRKVMEHQENISSFVRRCVLSDTQEYPPIFIRKNASYETNEAERTPPKPKGKSAIDRFG